MSKFSNQKLNIVVLGLSLTSSWGNGHATTYRALLSELAARGHAITFLERDVSWYANHRDMPNPEFCRLLLYSSLDDLDTRFSSLVAHADAVIVGSYVPEGVAVGEWATALASNVTAFYDIDTPVTLAKLQRGDYEYITPELISKFDLYLSFSGGPTLDILQQKYNSPKALPLYCSVDDTLYFPDTSPKIRWDLGYMGTYSDDRQPALQSMLLDAAEQCPDRRFVVAGPQYSAGIRWPSNVDRIEHLPPSEHREFYCAQRYTLNITRRDMIQAGYSPSVRLFEAAACGVPIISDYWTGLETILRPNSEILLSTSGTDTAAIISRMQESERVEFADNARQAVLANHTSKHRALELERYLLQALEHRQALSEPEQPLSRV